MNPKVLIPSNESESHGEILHFNCLGDADYAGNKNVQFLYADVLLFLCCEFLM